MSSRDLQRIFCCVKDPNQVSLPEAHLTAARAEVTLRKGSRFGTACLLFSLLVFIVGASVMQAQVKNDAAAFHDQSTPSTTNSASITTRAGAELILAFISTDSTGSPNAVVSSVSGAGLTWNLVVRSNTQSGTSEIWRAFASKPLSASVTATLTQSVVSSMTLESYQGTAATGNNGAGAIGATSASSSPKGAPTSSLVPLATGSLVVGVGNDFDSATGRTPVSGQSLIHQDLAPTGDTYWVQRLNASNTIKGAKITLADSAPGQDRYNFAICEIVPATAKTALLSLSSSSLNFGAVVDGTSKSLSVTLTSSGSAPLVISSDAVSGSGFALGAAVLPATLNPGQTLNLPVSFSPKAAGASSGILTIKSNSTANTTSIAVSGTGNATTSAQYSLSTSSLSFGSVADGSAKSLPIVLTSSGTAPLTVKADALSGVGFTVSSSSPLPVTLNPQQTIQFVINFEPTQSNSVSGSLKITTNATTAGTASIALAGSGVSAAHSVALSWKAPSTTGDPVVGYYVYRAVSGGVPTALNYSANVSTSYLDTTIEAGTTYVYEVKSVDASGVQSASSNNFTVSIPTT